MFRLLFLSFIALRVIACPVCCAGSDAHVMGVEAVSHSCNCSTDRSVPCQGGEQPPMDSPCPCEAGCECQATPEMDHRVVVDVQWMLDFAPLCLDTLDLSDALVFRIEEHPQRLDLPTGRSVRIAHASLLL